MIGTEYSRSASMIADSGSYHTRILALAACTITTIVSTAIPNERISEKFVRKFIVYPHEYSRINVERKASGSVMEANIESRKPTKRYIAINTNIRVVIASFASSA